MHSGIIMDKDFSVSYSTATQSVSLTSQNQTLFHCLVKWQEYQTDWCGAAQIASLPMPAECL